jgi:hypothetical protein
MTERYEDEVARKHKGAAKAARSGRTSSAPALRAAIDLQCRTCVGPDAEPHECSDDKCWLWPYRPKPTTQDTP